MMGQALISNQQDVFSEPINDRMRLYNNRYDSVLKRLKKNHSVKVGFQVIHRSIWKYDRIYEMMAEDPYFDPVVFVCPYLREDRDQMLEEINVTYDEMKGRGYEVVKTYDELNDCWIDIKQSLNPDIVFYSVPFDYTRDEYRIHHFTDSLSCYVPYFFTTNGKEGRNYDGPFHNLVWKNFYETDVHKKYAGKYARNKGANVVVTGYPSLDDFLYPSTVQEKDPWPLPDQKRVIWAPHHTIDGQGQVLNYSTFKKYHSFFQEIAEKYSDSLQIAFKPHPMLKEKLYKDKEWGKQRCDEYYQYWDELENGVLELSGYTNLFLSSDALIHDCSSFMVEYLCTSKPPLYLLHDEKVEERLHEFGKMALKQHYQAREEVDIIEFIEKQVLQQKDEKKGHRVEFINQYLKSQNGQSASSRIIDYIKKEIQ